MMARREKSKRTEECTIPVYQLAAYRRDTIRGGRGIRGTLERGGQDSKRQVLTGPKEIRRTQRCSPSRTPHKLGDGRVHRWGGDKENTRMIGKQKAVTKINHIQQQQEKE